MQSNTMEREEMATIRNQAEILADLERLSQAPGFVYTFCRMTWSALWMSTDEVTEIDWHLRPNNQELSLLLGLLVKHPLALDEIPSEEAFRQQAAEAIKLLYELHGSCAFPTHYTHGQPRNVGHDQALDQAETYRAWMLSGQGMAEPIFYGGPGAYIFQYLEMAAKRYAADEAWFQDKVGIGLSSILHIADAVHQLSRDRLRKVDLWSSHEEVCRAVLSAMSFRAEKIPEIKRNTLDNFLTKFSLVPSNVNQEFDSMGAYNTVHSHPAIALGDGRYWVPLLPNLAESIYESPFYWMNRDKQYADTALKNRGDATEIITRDLLVPVFGPTRVHRGVVVRKGRTDLTDLDVLAVSGNKALIVQCKSKKLTLTARAGHGHTLRRDFMQAVQDAYDQALRGRDALLRGNCTLTDSVGNAVQLPNHVDEVYILCITGDHYPAVITQARFLLNKADEDPNPVMMSVFDLDIISFYLRDRFDFLYYIRQRSTHAAYFVAENEKALLGFHLKRKLFPDDESPTREIEPVYSQLIDASFQVARGNWPYAPAADKLFHSWRNPPFDHLLHRVKLLADRQPTQQGTEEDLLFFLFDQAGTGADQLINIAQHLKHATRQDGKMHDTRLLMDGNRKGTSVVSFPAPIHSAHELFMRRDLQDIASAHKYRSRADEWLVLASFADSPFHFDIFGYVKDQWREDPQMEQLVETRLGSSGSIDHGGESLGRNQKCW